MSLLRAFIAVEIPPSIQDAIYAETAGLRKALSPNLVRWVAARNLHLTLKFLGDVSPANLEMLAQILGVEAAQHRALALQVSGLGLFPGPRRPRVIWVGIQAPAALESLQRGIEAVATRLGYVSEERPFSPHLTIGRIRQNLSATEQQRIRSALDGIEVGVLGRADVEAVHLYKSDLRPDGAVYTRLFSAPLAKS